MFNMYKHSDLHSNTSNVKNSSRITQEQRKRTISIITLIFQHFSNNILVSVHYSVPSLKNMFQQLTAVWFAYFFSFHIVCFNYKICISFRDATFYSHSYICWRVQNLTHLYKFKTEKCIYFFSFFIFSIFLMYRRIHCLLGIKLVTQ
jgi:hypothetical protein